MKEKQMEAEVFMKNVSVKRGFVTKITTMGAYVYDPKDPKKETPDSAEWYPFNAPNGTKTVVFEGQ